MKIRQTIANKRANLAYDRAIKKVQRKLQRLESRGGNVGNLVDINTNINRSNTYALKAHTRYLNQFLNSKFTQTTSGQLIDQELIKQYRDIEKRWNKEHTQYWNQFKKTKIISGSGQEDMTVSQYRDQVKGGSKMDIPSYKRNLKIETLRDKSQLLKHMKRLEYELSDDYRTKRLQQFNDNIERNLEYYNSPLLIREFRSLNDQQKMMLQDNTLFVEDFFWKIPSGDDVNIEELNDRIELMIKQIRAIKKVS